MDRVADPSAQSTADLPVKLPAEPASDGPAEPQPAMPAELVDVVFSDAEAGTALKPESALLARTSPHKDFEEHPDDHQADAVGASSQADEV